MARIKSKKQKKLDRPARAQSTTTRRPPGYYKERMNQHAAAGYTPDDPVGNTKKSDQSLLRKLERFCDTIDTSPKPLLQNLKAENVKSFLDWIEDNHTGKIKTASALNNYWRVLNRLYRRENEGRDLDDSVKRDCRNYKKQVIKRMGLRKRAKRKPAGKKEDIYRILLAHWVRCRKAYRDEKQRLMVPTGILLSYMTGCRLVSLFDTRVKIDEDPMVINNDKETIGEIQEDNMMLDTDDEFDHNKLEKPAPGRSKRQPKRVLEKVEEDRADSSDSDMDSDMDNSVFSDDGQDKDSDTDYGTFEDDDLDRFSDDSSVTDDGYDAGPEEAGVIVWRHIAFHIVRSPVAGRPNILLAKVTLLHTKGEDNKPRVKTFVFIQDPNPLLDLVGHLFAMAIHDDIFVPEFQTIEEIYWAKIPSHKEGMEVKIKREKLDLAVFRQPERSEKGYRTSDETPLKASTWSYYLKPLGRVAGLKRPLTQYVFRRTTINYLNRKAPSSTRDQIADHESNAVKYYLNEIVDVDTQAIVWDRDSDEEVHNIARQLGLDADDTAPLDLTDEQKDRIRNHPKTIRLSQESKELTVMMRQSGYRSWSDAEGTELYQEKMKVVSALNCHKAYLRTKLYTKAWNRHFRNADTDEFNRQFGNNSAHASTKDVPRTSPIHQIPERNQVIELICRPMEELTLDEQFTRQCTNIKVWVKLQDRQENQRRGRLAPISKQHLEPEPPKEEMIPEKCNPLQCPFCLGNKCLLYGARTKTLSKTNKLWDHVEGVHADELAAYKTGKKACTICAARNIAFFPESVPHFKNHTQLLHAIRLRA